MKTTANQREVMQAHMIMAAKLLANGTVTKAQYDLMVAESKKNVLGVKNGK
jgi:hypothetical protein